MRAFPLPIRDFVLQMFSRLRCDVRMFVINPWCWSNMVHGRQECFLQTFCLVLKRRTCGCLFDRLWAQKIAFSDPMSSGRSRSVLVWGSGSGCEASTNEAKGLGTGSWWITSWSTRRGALLGVGKGVGTSSSTAPVKTGRERLHPSYGRKEGRGGAHFQDSTRGILCISLYVFRPFLPSLCGSLVRVHALCGNHSLVRKNYFLGAATSKQNTQGLFWTQFHII